jgi:hypothetical protein
MTPRIPDDQLLVIAREGFRQRRLFFIHLLVYVIVTCMFMFTSGFGPPWFPWGAGGWGIAVAIHLLDVLAISGNTGWTVRQIKRQLDEYEALASKGPMSRQLSDEELYKMARQRIEEKKGFFSHLATYIVVNGALVVIWTITSGGGYPWFVWPLGGWGIGLAFHFLAVFVLPSHQGGWEQREIMKEIERLKQEIDK